MALRAPALSVALMIAGAPQSAAPAAVVFRKSRRFMADPLRALRTALQWHDGMPAPNGKQAPRAFPFLRAVRFCRGEQPAWRQATGQAGSSPLQNAAAGCNIGNAPASAEIARRGN